VYAGGPIIRESDSETQNALSESQSPVDKYLQRFSQCKAFILETKTDIFFFFMFIFIG
jgi:hypothetical protein